MDRRHRRFLVVGGRHRRGASCGGCPGVALAVGAEPDTQVMTTKSNPPDLHPTPGYHHVTVCQPGRLVLLAGQCPLDVTGSLVGPGDLLAQVGQVVRNIEVALESAGATPGDVVRTVIYVASAARSDLASVWSALWESAIGTAFTSASTLVGVAQLGYPGQLVEVDVTALLPGSGSTP